MRHVPLQSCIRPGGHVRPGGFYFFSPLPLERFTHDVKGFASLEDVPAGTEWPLNTFVILNDEIDGSIRLFKERFGGKARLILCTSHSDKLEASVLNQIYDFWPWPLSDTFARLEAVRKEHVRHERRITEE